jgi:ABC-type multidrug transport system fused ATPase/permease subunit
MELIKSIIKILTLREKRALILLLFIILCLTVFESLTVAFLYPLIEYIQNPSVSQLNNFKWLLGDNLFYDFGSKLFCFYLLVILLKTVFGFALIRLQTSFSSNFINRISVDLFGKYIRTSYSNFSSSESSLMVRNLTTEVNNVYNYVLSPSLAIISEGVVLISLFIVLLLVNLKITLSVLLFIVVIYYSYNFFTKKTVFEAGKANQENSNKLIKIIQESFLGIREIKLFSLEEKISISFNSLSANLNEGIRKNMVYSLLPRLLLDFCFYFGFSVALILAFINQNVNVVFPVLASFAAAGVRILPGISKLLTSYSSINFGWSSLLVVQEELENVQSMDDFIISQPIKDSINKMEFKNVSFKYELSEKSIFLNLNLSIDFKNTLAIIGESGSGKSTLMHLILGLLSPSSGNIELDGETANLNNLAWRRCVGYLPQSVFILDDTIINNIILSNSNEPVDLALLNDCINQAKLNELISKKDGGLNFKVGENGSMLSGGEIQRIGIARLLYSKKKVLVFDEPTSALDSKTESEILETILSLKSNCSVIIVSHNRKVMDFVDYSFEISNGQIITLFK